MRAETDGLSPGELAAAGPRTRGHEDEYRGLLDLILEGSRLHYSRPRDDEADSPSADPTRGEAVDPDLDLLIGDLRYAQGLLRLAELGDLAAVGELADLISLVAQGEAAEDRALVDGAWRAGAAAIGWGSTPAHEAAKHLARSGSPAAPDALVAAARRRVRGRPETAS